MDEYDEIKKRDARIAELEAELAYRDKRIAELHDEYHALKDSLESVLAGNKIMTDRALELEAVLRQVRDKLALAQLALRSTQDNWREQCLFDCDLALTEAALILGETK